MRSIRCSKPGLLLVALVIASTGPALAQSGLTPQQMLLLEQLPESQRDAALNELQRRHSQTAPQQLEFPETVLPTPSSEDASMGAEELEPRIKAETATLIIDFSLKQSLTPPEIGTVVNNAALQRLLGSKTYALSETGELALAGITVIPLAGLSAEEAARRIAAEVLLRPFDVEVSILPLTPIGPAALQAFGYDLFEGVPTTFAPATDIPVPPDYVIGPGDTVVVQYFGSENQKFRLIVDREGTLSLPEIGPVVVAAMRFDDMNQELSRRVAEQKIGVRASITMGKLRSIRIFVLGEAQRPGSYTVSGLSTMTNALFYSGGVKKIGSLRNIELKRNGVTVGSLDLYDLLLKGDTRDDERLQPGDVIFIPPVGTQVGIDGEARRPAIYELKGERTVGDLVRLAGGLVPSAFPSAAQIQPIDEKRERTIVKVDLGTDIGLDTRLRPGDVLRVYSVLDELDDAVVLSGHVFRPGSYQWLPGMRLSDLLPSLSMVRPKADTGYVLIRRERPPERQIEVRSIDLQVA